MAVTAFGVIAHEIWSPANLPLSTFLIYGLVNIFLVTASRASYVVLDQSQQRASNQGIPVLIYGAGKSGVSAVRELFENPAAGLRPVGFIDDDLMMQGKTVSGLAVLGPVMALESILHANGAKGLIVASSKIHPDRLLRATEICERCSISLFRLDVRLERLADGAAEETEAAPAISLASPPLPAPAPAPALSLFDAIPTVRSEPCPSCRSANLHRSKARNLYERLRKSHTPTRLFRCLDCGWRGWLLPLEFSTALEPPKLAHTAHGDGEPSHTRDSRVRAAHA
jgi:hypothetical protein